MLGSKQAWSMAGRQVEHHALVSAGVARTNPAMSMPSRRGTSPPWGASWCKALLQRRIGTLVVGGLVLCSKRLLGEGLIPSPWGAPSVHLLFRSYPANYSPMSSQPNMHTAHMHGAWEWL